MTNSGDETSDSDLLEAARKGDARALEALLGRHQDRVYRFSMKMCRDPEDAADVLQETLLALARSVGDFRGASSLSTWLYKVTRSFCIKARTRNSSVKLDGGDAERLADTQRTTPIEVARGPEDEAAGRETLAALESAIRSLEPNSREVLVLRDVEGLSAAEVAEILGISVEAVKSRLHRARAAVRETLVPALGLPSDAPHTGCPDVVDVLSRHLEGDLSGEVCSEMEKHVRACGRCGPLCDSLKRTLSLCAASAGQPVPPALQTSVRTAIRRFVEEAGR